MYIYNRGRSNELLVVSRARAWCVNYSGENGWSPSNCSYFTLVNDTCFLYRVVKMLMRFVCVCIYVHIVVSFVLFCTIKMVLIPFPFVRREVLNAHQTSMCVCVNVYVDMSCLTYVVNIH